MHTIHNAHKDLVRTVALKGDYLISGSYDETINIWKRCSSRGQNKVLHPNNSPDSVLSLQPRSSALINHSFNRRPSVESFNKTCQRQQEWLIEFQLRSCDWNPKNFGKLYNIAFDSRYLVACSQDSSVTCFAWRRNH